MTGKHDGEPRRPGIAGWAPVQCLTLRITVTQQFVGEVPGGSRLDFYYSGTAEGHGGVKGGSPLECAQPCPFPPELQAAINGGNVLSGNDWVIINSRGVLDIDSHLTLALSIPDNKRFCPVAGRLRGRAQLGNVLRPDGTRYFPPQPKLEEVFSTWEDGFEEDSRLPLAVSAIFDVPSVGYGDEQTELYAKSLDLASDLFTGVGHASFRKASHGAVKSLTLELHKLQPDPTPRYSHDKG